MLKTRLRFLALAAAAFSLALIVSCSGGAGGPSVETISWKSDGYGFIQYSTNDSAKLNYSMGCTYSSTNSAPSVVTATVKKISGASTYGYGVLFAVTDTNNRYRVMIDCTGYYRVDMISAGYTYAFQDWTYDEAIHAGYDAQNTIAVTYSAPNYSVAINGTHMVSFPADGTVGTSGYSGFYLSVGTSVEEDFPDTPVDVRFKMTAPVSIP
jgi:hypothetical protein